MTVVGISGLGAVTAFGLGVKSLWQGLVKNQCALQRSRIFERLDLSDLMVGEVRGIFEQNRPLALAKIAVDEAIEVAGWNSETISDPRTALIVATTKGDIRGAQLSMADEKTSLAQGVSVLSDLAAELANFYGFKGTVLTLSVACASGTSALGYGFRLLKQHRADRVLVVGVDGLSEFVSAGFMLLKALAPVSARPFDRQRQGLSVGEGAGAVTLELGDRSALAYLGGYACSNDANHITGPARDGSGLIFALEQLLKKFSINPDQVAAISAHGTGTIFNDAMEAVAFRKVFKERMIPVHSIKGAIGHTMGAAGLLEAIVCVLGLREHLWPPTVGLEEVDPKLDLDVVQNSARSLRDPLTILSTSSGFSGINSVLAICSKT